MRIHMEPTQTQHVPFHLGIRNARYTDPSRMIPCGLRGRAPSIQDPPSFWHKKQSRQLFFQHGIRSACCKNPCRMIHCGPRARAPQSGTSHSTCKKQCTVNIAVLSGMLRVHPPVRVEMFQRIVHANTPGPSNFGPPEVRPRPRGPRQLTAHCVQRSSRVPAMLLMLWEGGWERAGPSDSFELTN